MSSHLQVLENHLKRMDRGNILLGCCSMKASMKALGVNSKSGRICIRFKSVSCPDAIVLL